MKMYIKYLYHNKYLRKCFRNRSIWPIDGTLVGTTTLGSSGPESNDNEGILHTPQISRNWASLPDAV